MATTTFKGTGYHAGDATTTKQVNQAAAALLLVRIALALPMIFHGAGISFGAFGGPGLHGFSGFTHMPLPVAAVVGYGEFLGGLGILFGVLTRLAALGTAVIMLGAILLVHLPHGFDTTKGGFEYPLALLLVSIALMVTGGGPLSVAAKFQKPKDTGEPA